MTYLKNVKFFYLRTFDCQDNNIGLKVFTIVILFVFIFYYVNIGLTQEKNIINRTPSKFSPSCKVKCS